MLDFVLSHAVRMNGFALHDLAFLADFVRIVAIYADQEK